MDSIKEFIKSVQSWKFATIVFIIISAREIKDSKGEKQLLIIDIKGEFDNDVLTISNNFKAKYEQFLEVYKWKSMCLVLIKNMTTTSKGNQYLRAQHYTILTKVVDKPI